MKLSQFRFNLPKELIAEKPARNRDEARMMVVDRNTGKIEHHVFKDFIGYVDENDVVVYTIVIPAGTISWVLPATLTGEYEFQLISGNYCFWGMITL